MHKSITLFFFCLVATHLWSIEAHAQRNAKKTEYWIVKGYESRYDANMRKSVLGDAVYSNVFQTSCEPGGTGVTNQFFEYYNAYYAKRRGYTGLVRQIAFGPYDTWEEAEKQKRELLAKQSRSSYPNYLYIDRFSYLCN